MIRPVESGRKRGRGLRGVGDVGVVGVVGMFRIWRVWNWFFGGRVRAWIGRGKYGEGRVSGSVSRTCVCL
jgi:hypothetical protein